jgi:hypothetical protein
MYIQSYFVSYKYNLPITIIRTYSKYYNMFIEKIEMIW